ncbi:lysoplasmalogenase [Aeromicrobium wangtongii]|uniref:Lysoplasmalogenase n=1 Tax=Aeromicrobium wangtongii TaxID=2969247 RepID=A0ABY5MAM7_9ACTN|nr:lysoplasmalogenase [Aeromicrobium wangtongii]MCD9199769.1 lysoplasmalogenase [Aeromicrobium wangtongii]UUP14118.1 lysoplasmalogenase [Aeromicrobium wangtongii]
MTAPRSIWLIAFGTAAVVHLVLNGADLAPWASITKCLLAPLLAAWVVQQRGPRLLVVALAFCFLGDLFLEIEGMFILGMAAFAIAHISFITLFVQRGALDRLRANPLPLIGYVVAAIALVAWCWGGLEPGLKAPIPVYAALLVGTAAVSWSTDRLAGIGGALFLVSDGIIALGEAGRIDADATWTGLAIMALYSLAIYCLTTGIMARERRTVAAGTSFDPTIHTDCWPRVPSSQQ